MSIRPLLELDGLLDVLRTRPLLSASTHIEEKDERFDSLQREFEDILSTERESDLQPTSIVERGDEKAGSDSDDDRAEFEAPRIHFKGVEDFVAGTDVTQATMLPLQKLFDMYDDDKSGKIDEEEFMDVCEVLGLNFSHEELRLLFNEHDADLSGTLEFPEFVSLVNALRFPEAVYCPFMWSCHQCCDNISIFEQEVGKWTGGFGPSRNVNWSEQQRLFERQMDVGYNSLQLNRRRKDEADSGGKSGEDRLQRALRLFKTRLREMVLHMSAAAGPRGLNATRFCSALCETGGVPFLPEQVLSVCREAAGPGAGEDGRGLEVDYGEFERQLIAFYKRREHPVMSARRGPQINISAGLNAVGSVPAPHADSPEDARIREAARVAYFHSVVRDSDLAADAAAGGGGTSTVVLTVVVKNIISRLVGLGDEAWEAEIPCRPVAIVNFQEPRTGLWYQAGVSDWHSSTIQVPRPFEIKTTLDFFQALPAVEVVLYDLEKGEGTAKLQLETRFSGSTLNVRLRRGRHLPRADFYGLSDPFAVLTLGDQTFRSEVRVATLDPVWEQAFSFEVWSARQMEKETLEVEVFDWDVAGSDFLGAVRLRLKELRRRQTGGAAVTDWYHLRTRKGQFVWGNRVVGPAGAAGAGGEAATGGGCLGALGRLRSKLRRYKVEDVRNMVARPDHSLGSVQISQRQLHKAMQETRRNAAGKRANVTLGRALGQIGPGMVLAAWREWAVRQRDMEFLQLANRMDRYAAWWVTHTETVEGGDPMVRLQLACRRLPATDFFDLIDPYLVIKCRLPGSDENFRGVKSLPSIKQCRNPRWEPFEMRMRDLSGSEGYAARDLRIEVWDENTFRSDRFVGFVDTTLERLEAAARSTDDTEFDIIHARHAFNPVKNPPKVGALVCLLAEHRILPFSSEWNYTINLEVHPWKEPDAPGAG